MKLGIAVHDEADLIRIGQSPPCPACKAHGIVCNDNPLPDWKGPLPQWACSNGKCHVLVFTGAMLP